MVIERTARGEREFDIYSRLLNERIIFLGIPSTTWSPTSSSRSCCTWSPRTPTRTSRSTSTRRAARSTPGSRSTTRCSSSSPTWRPCASGSRCRWARCCWPAARHGKRMSLPNSRHPHPPAVSRLRGPVDRHRDPRAPRSSRRASAIDEIYAKHTGQPEEQVHRDMERDRFFKRRSGRRVRPDRPRHPRALSGAVAPRERQRRLGRSRSGGRGGARRLVRSRTSRSRRRRT